MDVEMYERALARTGRVVAATRREQLGDPTPCAEWDVRTLLNHIIGGCDTFAAGAAGDPTGSFDGTDYCAGDHVAEFKRAARQAVDAFAAPGSLEREFNMPWGDTPGPVALGVALADAAVHGWDLATATGRPADIDPDIAEALYENITQMLAPKGPFPRGASFEEPVEVPDDASPAHRLLGYLGRRP